MKYCEAAYILPSLINVKPLDPGLPVMFFDMVNVYLLDVVILRRPWGINPMQQPNGSECDRYTIF